MSSSSAGSVDASVASTAPAGHDWAQLGACAFIAALGALVVVDALGIPAGSTSVDPLGPRAVPLVLGPLLIVLALGLAVSVWRGSRPDLEGGEDVDLDARLDLKAIGMLVGVFAANIVLIDFLGWVISGALLFFGSAIVLGSRRVLLTALVSVALSLITFYGFAIGLGVGLPAGILQGIL